ncbi:N-acetyltransferase family protein [Microbacterium sp. YY-03]|uniref:GNAT family N-acetyltransferase n=1 Tax=Microbacterium sp. YY-03 TaxID=3421636 RepID=UPI003D164BEE
MLPLTLTDGAVLRDVRIDDAPALLNHIRELAEYEREPDAVLNTVAAIESTFFGDNPHAFAHVVERDGSVVGIAIWFLTYSTWTGTHGIWLEDLHVYPSERGRGYGKQLMASIAAVCGERGYRRMEWTVLNWNEPAIGLYRSLGAAPMDEWTTQRLVGDELSALAATLS